jgi:hypothetical protein
MSLRQRWQQWTHREDELDEEIQAHLRMAERDRTDRGETTSEARVHARYEFGNILLTKEVTRAQWGWVWIDQRIQDFRFAVRQLLKSGAFARDSHSRAGTRDVRKHRHIRLRGCGPDPTASIPGSG